MSDRALRNLRMQSLKADGERVPEKFAAKVRRLIQDRNRCIAQAAELHKHGRMDEAKSRLGEAIFIRKNLNGLGIILKDTAAGTSWEFKRRTDVGSGDGAAVGGPGPAPEDVAGPELRGEEGAPPLPLGEGPGAAGDAGGARLDLPRAEA